MSQAPEHQRHPTGKPPAMRLAIENRFWEKIEWEGKTRDECWEWKEKHATVRGGYGAFNVGDGAARAHRVAYALDTGQIPGSIDPDIDIRHVSCHNPRCCNPSHLEAGTRSDNMRDSVRDGRIGEFDDEDVRAIRATHYAGDASLQELADAYGKSKSMIHRVTTGRSYRHVPMPPYDDGDDE